MQYVNRWGKYVNRWVLALLAALALVAVGLTSASAGGAAPAAGTSPADAKPPVKVGAAAVGPATTESLFVPVAPCRAADTRIPGAKIPTGTTRDFYIRGTTGFPAQGGKSGGCGIPPSATGATFNVTVPMLVPASAKNGYMIGYPAGSTPALTNFISYHTVENTTANPTFKLAPFGSNPHLTIKNSGVAEDVILDVTGYYAPQIEGTIDNGGIVSGTPRIVSAVHNGTGSYTVTVDSDVSNCSPTVSARAGNVYGSAATATGTKVQVFVWILEDGNTVPVDGTFSLNVAC